MKQFYLFLTFLFCSIISFAQVTYNGNGNIGFGGPLGNSNLTVSDDGSNINISFVKGGADFNNEMVIYIDSQVDGFTSTLNFADPDTGDKLRRAITGAGIFTGGTRSTVNFPSGFEADFAIAVNTGFGGLWELVENASYPFITAIGNPNSNTDSSFSMTFNKTDIGLNPGDIIEFRFVVTYMDAFGGNGVFRSDEGYGNGLPSGNPGTNDVSFTTSELYRQSTTYTYNASWAPSDPNGISTPNDVFEITVGGAIISSNTDSRLVSVAPGASLTVNSGITLDVSDMLILESQSDSFSSLILDGTINGSVQYNRFVNSNSNGNDLIAPPLSGQSWSDFLSPGNASALLDDGNTAPTTYAFGPFDKGLGDYVNYNDGTTAPLTTGVGYRAATDTGATLSFVGTVETGVVTVDIESSGASFTDWNLVGNPYPSYINIKAFLDTEVVPGVSNLDITLSNSGVYGYDGDPSDGWNTISNANSDQLMAPGQGFFVAADPADVAAYDLTFDPSIRRTGSSDDFIAGREANDLTFLELRASTADDSYVTDFYFNDESSTALDPGYDAVIFGGAPPAGFSLYSLTADGSSSQALALQSLNSADLIDVTIPLGIQTLQGAQLTFTIDNQSLPGGTEVYLEDTEDNTMTLLTAGDYVLTPTTDVNGTGRFFLRFTNSVLSTPEHSDHQITIYTDGAEYVSVAGQLNTKALAKIYDLQGRLVMTRPLLGNVNTQRIDISALSAGIYVIKVDDDTFETTQKFIKK